MDSRKDKLGHSSNTFFQQKKWGRQKQALKQLLEAVIDHDPLEAASILTSYPELLLAKPSDYDIQEIQSKLTQLRYLTIRESVFSIAQKLLLTEMLNIMLPHYFKQLNDARQLSDAKNVVSELEKQWIFPKDTSSLEEKKIEETHKILQDSYTQDYLQPLIKAFATDSHIEVSWIMNEKYQQEAQIHHINSTTKKAIAHFKAALLQPKTIEDCIDINQLLIAAYHAYDKEYLTFRNAHQSDAFAILVIGFIQSVMSPSSLSKIFGIHTTVLEDGRSFYPTSQYTEEGLGFHFLCDLSQKVAIAIKTLDTWECMVHRDLLKKYYIKRLPHQDMIPLYNIHRYKASPKQKVENENHSRRCICVML